MTSMPLSAVPRKRVRVNHSQSNVRPEDQILDLFGSAWLKNPLCVDSYLVDQANGDEAELDLFESTFHSRVMNLSGQACVAAETATLGVESE